MNSSNIKKYDLIKQENLDQSNYTISLLNEALHLGLIDQAAMEAVQAQAMTILADLIRKYTKGESSSLRVETSQRLLMSVFYAIDAGLGSNDPQEALESLLADDLRDIYKLGLDALELNLKASRDLYQETLQTKLAIPNDAYHSTIEELQDFFKRYDILYNAQYATASIDYPLLFDDMDIEGVFYIKQYLEKLNLENRICSLFPIRDIKQMLFNYSRVYRINTRETLINILEIVLSNAIFSILAGNRGSQLNISPEQFEQLAQRLLKFDRSRCAALLNEAIEVLLSDLQIEAPAAREYISKFHDVLYPRFINALENNSLHNLIIVNAKATQQFDIMFDEGNSLDDERFRQVVDEIMNCAAAEDKAAIIRSKIQSLGDFIDILEAECLFAEEYHVLFSQLGDMELSILARIVFIEDIRTNLTNFSLQNQEEVPQEHEWQTSLYEYLQLLTPQRIKTIENYIKSRLQMNEAWEFLG